MDDAPDQLAVADREEFITRFKQSLKRHVGANAYCDNEQYINEIAPTYWADLEQRSWGPEECAGAEASEWGEE